MDLLKLATFIILPFLTIVLAQGTSGPALASNDVHPEQGDVRGWFEDAISTVSDAVKAANSNSEKARADFGNTIRKASDAARTTIQTGLQSAINTFNGTLENIRQLQNATRNNLG